MRKIFLLSLAILGIFSCQPENWNGQAWASTSASRQYNFVDDRNNAIPITASRMDAEFDNVITKLNQKVIIASSAPSSPIAGQLWYDSTNKYLKQYRNSEWVQMGAIHYGASAMSTTQAGDVWIDNNASELVIKVRNKANDGWLTLIQSTGFSSGMIMMWSGTIATIPSGWVLCNGSNSTPDLRDRFVIGAKQDDSGTAKTNVTGSLTQTGGAATVNIGQTNLPSYNLSVTAYYGNGGSSTGFQGTAGTGSDGAATTVPSGGSGTALSVMNPYYALAFIMKT